MNNGKYTTPTLEKQDSDRSGCPTTQDLADYEAGPKFQSKSKRSEIAAHLESCAACRSEISNLYLMGD